MPSTLPAVLHPQLVSIAQTVTILNETNLAIAEVDAGIEHAQRQIDKSEHLTESAQDGGSSAKLFYAKAIHQGHADQLTCHLLARQLLDAHLQAIHGLYLELENALKATILDVSGGDTSLFALYVPERPADLPTV